MVKLVKKPTCFKSETGSLIDIILTNKPRSFHKTQDFVTRTSDGVTTNKEFWKKLKPFLTNKGCFSKDKISIEVNNELVSDEKILTESFSEHYINIVEKSSGTKPSSLGDSINSLLDETTVRKIIDTYRDHPSVIAIKSPVTQNRKFNLPHATSQEINKIINLLSSDKATGPDGIPVKFIKMSANVIDSHLANIISKDVDLNCYSENAKTANVRLIFKKDERTKVQNY